MSVRAENSIKDVFAAGNPATHVRAPFTSGDFALYGTVILAWGFSWYFIHLQGGVDPEISVVWRFLIAAPLMMGLAVIRGESLRFPLADHLRFMVLGTAIFSTNFTLFYYATQLMASGLVAIVFSLAAVLNMAL